jgi:aminopeptidase N
LKLLGKKALHKFKKMRKIAFNILSLIIPFIGYSQMGVYPNEENLRSDTIDVLDYEIHLDLTDYSSKTISGFTKVSCSAKMNNVNFLSLDLLKFTIDSVTLNTTPLNYSYNDTLLRINLGSSFNSGDNFEVTVYYHGTTLKDPSGWGGVYFGNDYIFNLGVGFEDNPHNIGRYWFPCFDNFKERSTYNLYLTTLDNQYATSIGNLISSTPQPNNKTEWYWKMDETIPTYLAMFAVNYYTIVTDTYNGINGNIPIALYAKSSDTTNLKASFANLKLCMDAFEDLYGPYQFNKIGYTVVNFSSGAMEHASNITYPINAVNGNLGSEDLMAHELSHQWWGNYATTLTPQDMWLNEGMASFSANYFIEYVYGWETAKVGVKSTLFNILRFAHIDEDGYRAISGVPHDLTYGDHVYRKGALVAQNLRMLLGENQFGPAVTGFLNSRAFQSMTSLQFRDYLQNQTTGDVNGFFDGWVFNGGFPDYKIVATSLTGTIPDVQHVVTVQQKTNHAPNPFAPIPIEVGFYDKTTFELTTHTILVGPDQTSATIDESNYNSFITLNPNNKLCYATTDDIKIIKQTGPINYVNAMMLVDVKSVTDSALLKIEHHWAAPDGIKDWANKPYILSDYRYWVVDGILPPGFEATAGFFYDGRENSGYLDSFLVNVTEDSLVLLYRESPSDDWSEYPYYSKNTLGSSSNKFGRMELSKLLKGEYTLANIDHSVLSTGSLSKPQNELKIYPNPSNEKVTIEWSRSEIPQIIEIYSFNGTRVLTFHPNSLSDFSFNSKSLKSGQYVAQISFENEVISSPFLIAH